VQCLTRLPFASTWVHPRFLVGPVFLFFLVSSVVFLLWFIFILCPVSPMMPVSMHCPFLINPSVFSDVYYILFCSVFRFSLCWHFGNLHAVWCKSRCKRSAFEHAASILSPDILMVKGGLRNVLKLMLNRIRMCQRRLNLGEQLPFFWEKEVIATRSAWLYRSDTDL
jgi:hypothetical protein